MTLTLDPCLSSRRNAPNWTYFVPISSGMLTTLPSVHVNLSSSCRLGSVPGLHAKRYWWSRGISTLSWILACMFSIISLAATWMLVILPVCIFIKWHKFKCWLLLNDTFREGAAIFQLLACKAETLLHGLVVFLSCPGFCAFTFLTVSLASISRVMVFPVSPHKNLHTKKQV